MEKLYKELIEDKNCPVQFEYAPSQLLHLKFKNHNFPWSIVSKEFNYIFDTIVSNNLKRGFEACTGIGLSALSSGMAMKVTGGKVITLDAYIEEFFDNFVYPKNVQKIIVDNSDGYKNINYLINKFSLEKNLFAEVGWSPDDIPNVIEKHFSEPLDYIFIDSGHTEEQLFKEIKTLVPYTNSNTIWLFHDVIPTMWTETITEYCKNTLSKKMNVILDSSQGCSNLGILEKL